MTAAFDTVADLILADLPRHQRFVIAIDGVDGSGKTTFTTALAARVTGRPVIVIHADDFLNPRKIRHRLGRHSPEGFFSDTYNLVALKDTAVLPLTASGSGHYRARSYDPTYDTTVLDPIHVAAPDAIVLVEGMFLHRDELVSLWDTTVFLDVPFTETARRMALRDGTHPDPEHPSMTRYVQGQRLYFHQCNPKDHADHVIDNTNPNKPRAIKGTAFRAAR